jgi:uncharacterized membrane protein
MPKTTLLGHPVHPQLIAVPSALLPFTFVMDVLFRRTRKRSYREAAYYGLMGGVAGGAVAGMTGAMDYLTIPSGTEEKRTANVHAALNVGLIAASVTNLVLRMRGDDGRSPLPYALSAIGAIGVLVSGWYGGHLVYEHGVRVKGRDVTERAPEVALPADRQMAAGLSTIERAMPAAGPELHAPHTSTRH